MNTARVLDSILDVGPVFSVGAVEREESRERRGTHLRLVVDNSDCQPHPAYELPAWYDKIGNITWYLVLFLVLVNVANQIILW